MPASSSTLFCMASLKLSSFVLFVNDVSVSKKFYQDLLSQGIAMDLGVNCGV